MQLKQINAAASDVYQKAYEDINFFAGLALPEVCRFPLPSFYVAAWRLILSSFDKPESLLRFALGLPRGHAKTTFVKIIICWLIVYDKISFALIICSNQDLAENLLADIHQILDSPNITAVYGLWSASLAIDKADTKKAAYHARAVSLVARGWSAGIRGLNLQNHRPDFILCDDVQTRKNDESPAERDALLKELTGTIFKALAPTGNRCITYVGNMYSEDCILNKFRKSPSWISLITGAILENGQPLWPELHSLPSLMSDYYHDEEMGLVHIWFSEVMNDPKSTATSLLPHALPSSPIETLTADEVDGSFITIDPAGFRASSDDNVICVHYKHDNVGYIVKTVRGILDPAQLIQQTLALALDHQCSLIAVEDTGYQQTLGFWLTKYVNEYNIQGLTVIPLRPKGRSKESRIRLFIQELYRGGYYILDDATRRDFVWQASLYKLGRKDNRDDLLDALAYGIDVRNEFWHLLTTRKARTLPKPGVVPYNTPF